MTKIVVHGGAGAVSKSTYKNEYTQGVNEAANIGYDILEKGGSALDAVEQAVKSMEDHFVFNAGKGSVLTRDGKIEMDALIMDGYTGKIGGVMAVSRIKNPIVLSRKILEDNRHHLFTNIGEEELAKENGIDLIDPEELITERSLQRLKNYKAKQEKDEIDPEGREKYGTVGAVAIDDEGKLAAATSTGGTLGKKPGRVGDTPIVGAGTYADREVAVSATGVGEHIIQGMIGIAIKYENRIYESLQSSVEKVMRNTEQRFGPAGVIAIDNKGRWVQHHTTPDLIWAFTDGTTHSNWLQFD